MDKTNHHRPPKSPKTLFNHGGFHISLNKHIKDNWILITIFTAQNQTFKNTTIIWWNNLNHFYLWERVWRLKLSLKIKWIAREYSQEAIPWSESRAEHMTGMRRVMVASFREYFTEAFLQNTCKTFCFAILAYLLHHVFIHTMYTLITYIL